MEEASKNPDVRSSFSLIDFPCDDDFLLVTQSSDGLPNQRSSGNDKDHSCNGKVEGENAGGSHGVPNSSDEMEEAHGALVSAAEPYKNRKSSKCNLRKSLAWDNAFFTSEGILDPDELEIVSKTCKKSPLIALPGIQEDLRKSGESTTTLGSDASALENLEVELFEDIRASIQKSGYDYGRTSDSTLSGSKAGQREPAMACPVASKNEQTSYNKMKPVSKPLNAYKRQSLSKQALEKNPKEVLVHPRAVTASSGEQNTSLKPPKILANPPSTRPTKSSVAPTKKILPSSECIKAKNNVTTAIGHVSNQKYSVPSKKPVLGAEPRVPSSSIPSPTSSRSSGSSRSTKTMPTTPSSTKKGGITKTLRNRIESRNGNPSPKDLIINKTPLGSSKSRMESGSSHLTAYVISTSKVSPNISPASSIDGFSSESSSSTCTASQMSDSSKATSDISCASSHGGDLLMRAAPELPGQIHTGQQSSFPRQSVERACLENGVFSHPAAANGRGTCTNYNSMQKFRPSGLRMPSPKIGFFDAEKNGVRTSNAGLQFYSGLQNSLLKKNASGINNLDGALKQRPSKLQHAKPLTQFETTKFSSQVTGQSNQARASSLKPAYHQHSQQLSNLSPEPSSTPKTKSLINTNAVVQDSSATSRQTKSKTRELQSDVAYQAHSKTANMNVEEHGDQNVITRNILVESNKESSLEKSISQVLLPVAHSDPARKLAEENADSKSVTGEHVFMGQKENVTESNYNSSPVPQ